MNRTIAVAVASTVIAAAPVTLPAVAHAEPVVPQPETPCPANLAGALTQLPDLMTFLECRGEPGLGHRWRVFDDPYPHRDRWFTYGPVLTLHGEGQRNREIDSGDWIAAPQDPGSRCNAAQVAIVSTGLSAPQVSTGQPGQPLELSLQPLLFTIELSGYCLWQKVR